MTPKRGPFAPLRLAVGLLLLQAFAVLAGNIPIDASWAWVNNSLTLNYRITKEADAFPVNSAVGNMELGGVNTIGNAYRRAAETWNAAMAGMTPRWTLTETAMEGPPFPWINVRMSMPGGNGVPGELDDPGEGGAPNDDDVPKDQKPNNKRVLGFFRLLERAPDGTYKTAEIVFNRNVTWGIDNNRAPNIDMFYDPIIVALHEIGHALHLDHDRDGGTIGNPVNGNVMRPFTDPGTHHTNPTNPMDLTMDFARNPSAMDVASAKQAAALPEPGTMALLASGAVGMAVYARRRRRMESSAVTGPSWPSSPGGR